MSQAGAPPVRWVFLDRDGTINVPPPKGQYVTHSKQLQLLPGAAAAIRVLNRAGVWVGIVTNQRGVALGCMGEDELDAIHAHLRELLARAGARLDAIYHCPHEQGVCACRKPQPGLLLAAKRAHPGLDFAHAAVVGDSDADVQAGLAVGAHTILLTTEEHGKQAGSGADHIACSLLDAVSWLREARGLGGGA
jgi:D-glycero-D-manno-heptose 1,7-bisphosphate phosphatase